MVVDPTQHVVEGDVIINAQVAEEQRRSCLASHHRSTLGKSVRRLNHDIGGPAMPIFQIATERSPAL
ncbi:MULTISPECIES: hypothetical protein [Rhizobium/Agrobacterium group]|jgi:hypothetical protein|uniref:hypothetical protein n=1 Tax=Rhizobium/Agrobacterium group TaxID=227290 RepID=UPI0012E3C370|nr:MULTISPECIES: hypothetical protein [Rhizobium/Agrobacterium group]